MNAPLHRITPVSARQVAIRAGLWGERQSTNRDRTIPAIYRQLEKSGRIAAWDITKKREKPKRHAVVHMFGDSDSAKWIEAVGHSLYTHPDPALEAQADALIQRIQAAQLPDGYVNSYFTAVEPGNRWRNLRDCHEMYNAGHLIEGAVAYYQATGKTALLDVLRRYVDLIDATFGAEAGKKRGYDGHPEMELALMKLYRASGEPRYLKLAKYFIDERGRQPHYFDLEARERGDDPADFWAQSYRYCQAHAPIREQPTATGHAVRACYLYAGVADVALETGDASLLDVSRRLWDDLTQHQLYITGGLGPAHSNEGFTFAYDLPNETAYAETCASIALALWAHRMFHLDPHGRYIDVMERALYNGVLSGLSYEGTHFFYANPLASYPNVNPFDPWSGINAAQHYRREEWFICPCCPPNVARIIASIGSYCYSVSSDTLYVHLYQTGEVQATFGGTPVQFRQETNYPWDGEIQLRATVEQPTQFTLALRIPGWCRDVDIRVNGTPLSESPENGYVRLNRRWSDGDEVRVTLKMPVERMVAHPDVRMDAGQVALQRGPSVYCLEQIDNGPRLANVAIPRDARLNATLDSSLFGGVSVISGDALRIEPAQWSGDLYRSTTEAGVTTTPLAFKAIPYALWANREPGEMRVWLRES